MKNRLKFLTVLGLFLILSCASNIRTEKFTEASFNNFKTFAYLPSTTLNSNEFNKDNNNSVEKSLIAFMNANMIEKGFSVNNDNPDLVILLTASNQFTSVENNYNETSTEKNVGSNSPNFASVSSTGYKRYFSNSSASDDSEPYQQGTLVVEVFNTKNKELLWVGIAKDFKSHISDQTLNKRMVDKIFEAFPE